LIDTLETEGGGIVYSQYLDDGVAQAYNTHVRDLFIDTISHRSLRSADCDLPPYCLKKKNNRPLRVLHHFIQNSEYLLREDADLVPIIISNLDEKPFQQEVDGRKVKTVIRSNRLIDEFQKKYPDKRMYVVNIIINPADENCLNGNPRGSEYGSYLAEASHLTQGMMLSLCPIFEVNAFTDPIISFLNKKKQQSQ